MSKLLGFLLLLWAIAFLGSFVMAYLQPGHDYGMTAGFNRLRVFMLWQVVASVLALAALALRWTSRNPATRRLAALPAVVLGLMLSVLAVLFLWARFHHGAGPMMTPPPAVTAPGVDS